MKAKHLLMAMALPTLFAACQQDEFTADGTNADALQGRKSIGQVSFTTGDAANTRWAVGGDYNTVVPEDVDGLSVNLVDVPGSDMDKCFLNTQHDYAIDNYRVTGFRSTNFRFNRANGGWTNEGNLVEGNYVIVAPFVKGQGRNPIEAKLPVKQQLAFGKDGKLDPASGIQEMLKGDAPFMVSYKFLEAGKTGKGMPLEFQNMYSYPLVTVKNSNVTYAQGLVLRQVVIENPAGFVLSAPLSHDGIRNAMINEVFAPEGTDNVDQALLGSWTAVGTQNPAGNLGNTTYWADYAAANKYGAAVPKHAEDPSKGYIMLKQYNKVGSDFTQLVGGTDKMPWTRGLGMKKELAPATSDLLAENGRQMTNYIVVNMPAEGVKMAYNESISFNVIMPADTYNNAGGQELKIYAIFDNVTWVKTLNTNTTITTLPGKQYPRQDYTEPSTSAPEVKGQKGGYFNIYTNDQARDFGTYKEATSDPSTPNSPHVAVVKTTEELATAVFNARSDEDWTITIAGDDVVWNKTVNDKVSGSLTQSINVQGHIKIAGNITIPNYVSFEDAVIESGDVTIGGTNTSLGLVLVGKGATLNLGELANTAANKAKIYNAGTLALNKDNYSNVFNYSKLFVNATLTNVTIKHDADNCDESYGEILSKDVELKPELVITATDAAVELTVGEAATLKSLTIIGGTKGVTFNGANTKLVTVEKGVTISGKVTLATTVADAVIIKTADLVLNATPTFAANYAGQIQLSTTNLVTGTVAATLTSSNIMNSANKTWNAGSWTN